MQVAKWGNSLAVRIPKAVAEKLRLHEGDEIEITAVSDERFNIRRIPDPEEILDRLNKFRGKLPADFKFDRDEANAR